MAQKKVLLHFDPNGGVQIEAQGYEGGTCLQATQPFENLFTQEVKPREMVGACAEGHDKGERVR